jgi:hypothetical protein
MNMKKNDSERGPRPAFLGMMTLALALTCVPVWLLIRRPAPPSPVEEQPPTVETPTPAEPAVADAPADSAPAPVKPVAAARPGTLEGEWGIQVASVGLTMAGGALDFRYTVVDAEQALLLAQGSASAYLIDQTTGTKISMTPPTPTGPSAAHSRARMARQGGGFPPSPNRLAAGRTNSILLPNPAGLLKSGSIVTVVVGDIQTQNVRVK